MFLEPLTKKERTLPESCNVVIKNNTFDMGAGVKNVEGDAVRICGSEEIPIPGITVKDNTISGGKRYGIFATHAPSLVIDGNQISGTKNNGILVAEDSASAVIRGNSIQKAGGKAAIGIYESNDGIIAGNEITSPAESGIYLYNGVKNCTVGAVDKETKDTDKNRIVKRLEEGGFRPRLVKIMM